MFKLLSSTVTVITQVIKWVQFALQILGLFRDAAKNEEDGNQKKEESKRDCD